MEHKPLPYCSLSLERFANKIKIFFSRNHLDKSDFKRSPDNTWIYEDVIPSTPHSNVKIRLEIKSREFNSLFLHSSDTISFKGSPNHFGVICIQNIKDSGWGAFGKQYSTFTQELNDEYVSCTITIRIQSHMIANCPWHKGSKKSSKKKGIGTINYSYSNVGSPYRGGGFSPR